jgi:alanine racemase
VSASVGVRVCVGRVPVGVGSVGVAVDVTDLGLAQEPLIMQAYGGVLDIDEVAQAAGTVGYELMCALAQRVPVRVA